MNKYEHIIKEQFINQFGNNFNLIIPEKQMVDASQDNNNMWYCSRCDLLALQNNNIVAIEIKSKYDTLKRLKNQLRNYYLNANKIILILDNYHFMDFNNYMMILELSNQFNVMVYEYKENMICNNSISKVYESRNINNSTLSKYWLSNSLYKMYSKNKYHSVTEMREELSKMNNKKLQELTCTMIYERYHHQNNYLGKRDFNNMKHYVHKR
jgi:hypothetical protein